MPLIPFAPGVDACGVLLVKPPNRAQILQGGVVTATSTASGFDAADLAYDDGARPWRSGVLGGSITVEATFPAVEADFVALVGTNVQVPDGYVFTGELATSPVVGPVVDLDPVVRTDDSSLPPLAAKLLAARLSIVPHRFATPTVIDTARWVFDTTSGNGLDLFLQAAYVFVGTAVGFRFSLLDGNAVTHESLAREVRTAGARAEEVPRFPVRSQVLNPNFLDAAQDGELVEWLGSGDRASKGMAWRTPEDLDTFAPDAFFGKLGPSVQRRQRRGGIIALGTSTTFKEAR